MLDVCQLTHHYDDFIAVDHVSFRIHQGEIIGLLGHNGAGKTTIMKILSGFLEPQQGHVRLDKIDVALTPKQVQRDLGYLPENLPVYPEMMVADYLDYAAQIKGLTGALKQKEIKRVMQATDITSQLLTPITTLSRGYKQRVGVAQALLGKPKLLILDEPTNGLDPTQTEYMRALIRDIAQDATVILSTHILQEVEALCNRVLILQKGRLVVDEQLAQLRQSTGILLTTSMKPDIVSTQLGTLDAIQDFNLANPESIEQARYQYRLQVKDINALPQISADIARLVVQSGEQLFALQPQYRDLESLFREVNDVPVQQNQEEVFNHAA